MSEVTHDKTVPGKPGEIIASSGRRLAVARAMYLDNWYISHSPRNDSHNAEGDWAEWVALAKLILAEDAKLPKVTG